MPWPFGITGRQVEKTLVLRIGDLKAQALRIADPHTQIQGITPFYIELLCLTPFCPRITVVYARNIVSSYRAPGAAIQATGVDGTAFHSIPYTRISDPGYRG